MYFDFLKEKRNKISLPWLFFLSLYVCDDQRLERTFFCQEENLFHVGGCRNLPFGGRATRDSQDACSRKGIRAESPPTFIWGKHRKNRKRRDLRTLSERYTSLVYLLFVRIINTISHNNNHNNNNNNKNKKTETWFESCKNTNTNTS